MQVSLILYNDESVMSISTISKETGYLDSIDCLKYYYTYFLKNDQHSNKVNIAYTCS